MEVRFFVASRPAQRPTQLPVQRAPGFFPGVKQSECGADQAPPSAEVANGLLLYLHLRSVSA